MLLVLFVIQATFPTHQFFDFLAVSAHGYTHSNNVVRINYQRARPLLKGLVVLRRHMKKANCQ